MKNFFAILLLAVSASAQTRVEVVNAPGETFETTITSGDISKSTVAVRNVVGQTINPATEETTAEIKNRADLLATEATADTLFKQGQSAVVSTGTITAHQGGTWTVLSQQVAGSTATVRLVDSDGNEAQVNSAGRLEVALAPPSAPGGTTIRTHTGDSSVSTSSSTIFVIPSGSTMTFQRVFGGGGAVTIGGAKMELYFDPACTNVVASMTLIAKAYLSGSNFEYTLADEFVGNGTSCVRLTRTNLAGGSIEIYTRWAGYTTP